MVFRTLTADKLSYSTMPVSIIYLHRISDNRIFPPDNGILGHVKALLGDRWPEKVVVVTTMWSHVERALSEKRQLELEARFKAWLTSECKVMPFKDTFKSAWDILDAVTKSDEVDTNNSLLLHKEPVNLDPSLQFSDHDMQGETSLRDELQRSKWKSFLNFIFVRKRVGLQWCEEI